VNVDDDFGEGASMNAFRDTRIVAGLLAILVAPAFVYCVGYADEFRRLYVDLDSELGTLAQFGANDEALVILGVALVALVALTFRSIGPQRASGDAVVAVRAGVVATMLGAWLAFEIAIGPVVELLDKIR
jgi:hypothetical protein